MTKQQVMKMITPLNADYFLDNFEKTDGRKERIDFERTMIDQEESFHFEVVGNRTGFIEWNYETSKFHAFSIPTNVLETVLKDNLGISFNPDKHLKLKYV